MPRRLLATTLGCTLAALTAALTAGCRPSVPAAPAGAAPWTLSVVGTNDLHGGILEDRGRGGLALLDGYLTNLRQQRTADGGAVLLLDAGDLSQGTLESNMNEGAVVVDAYNTIGYDAVALGNHDFDFGPAGPAAVPKPGAEDPRGALKARIAQSHFPWLSANLHDSAGGPAPVPGLRNSTIITRHGIRIGIVGLLTQPTLSYVTAALGNGLSLAPLAPALQAEAARLRAEGATVVVGLAHEGARCTDAHDPRDVSSCDTPADIFDLARSLAPGTVDAIVAGHRHEMVAHEVNGIPIIESYFHGRAFGRIDLAIDSTGHVVSHHILPTQDLCARQVPGASTCAPPEAADAPPARYEDRAVAPSARLAAVLQPAVDAAASLKARSLNATLTVSLPLSDFLQSPLGNLETDWMRAAVPGADVAVNNSTGLRSRLDAGPLTYGRLFELAPFDNQLLTVAMTGAQLRTVVAGNMLRSGSMVLLSGATATVTCGADGRPSVALARESGAPIADDERLRVVTSDFLATGGDDYFTPVLPLTVLEQRDNMRDEIARAIANGPTTIGPEVVASPPRVVSAGGRPLRCGR